MHVDEMYKDNSNVLNEIHFFRLTNNLNKNPIHQIKYYASQVVNEVNKKVVNNHHHKIHGINVNEDLKINRKNVPHKNSSKHLYLP